jgi:1,4-dihydroxy-2-naphthoate octaprenyltransferase
MEPESRPTAAVWLRATRPQFFTVIVLPILLGAAAARADQGRVSLVLLALSVLAGVLCHAGINVLNDYFDHRSGADDLNEAPLTPFAGGSRMIQDGLLSAAQTRRYGMGLLSTASLLGLALVYASGPGLLAIGAVGVLSGYFYSAPPLQLSHRGLGEVFVGLNFGVLAVCGAYFVQVQGLNAAVVLISLPPALLVAAILLINEFPDEASDRAAGKGSLVVRLGAGRARLVFAALVCGAYLTLSAAAAAGALPLAALAAWLTLPLAVIAVRGLYSAPDASRSLLPAMKATIALHTTVSVVMIAAFFV